MELSFSLPPDSSRGNMSIARLIMSPNTDTQRSKRKEVITLYCSACDKTAYESYTTSHPCTLCAKCRDECLDRLRDSQSKEIRCKSKLCEGKTLKLEDIENTMNTYTIEFYCDNNKFGCPEIMRTEDMENHRLECRFRKEECQYCKQLIFESQLQSHEVEDCEERPKHCPYQSLECEFTGRKDDIQNHLDTSVTAHQELMLKKVLILERQQNELLEGQEAIAQLRIRDKEIDDSKKDIEMLKKYLLEKEGEIKKLQLEVEALRSEKFSKELLDLDDLKESLGVNDLTEKVTSLEQQGDVIEQLEILGTTNADIQLKLSETTQELESVKTSISLSQQTSREDTQGIVGDLKTTEMESWTSMTQKTWAIDDIENKLVYDPGPLYSKALKAGAYKFRGKLVLSEVDETSNKSYVGLYIELVESETDALQEWPCPLKFTGELINMKNTKSLSEAYFEHSYASVKECNKESFKKPSKGRPNIAIGSNKLIEYEKALSGDFVRDNKLFVRFRIVNERELISRLSGLPIDKLQSTNQVLWLVEYVQFKKEKASEQFSPEFHTETGYKFKIQLCLNGFGNSGGSHISAFLILVKGDYDEDLDWPCPLTFIMELVRWDSYSNMSDAKCTISLETKEARKYLGKPKADNEDGLGDRNLLLQETAFSSQYLVNDKLLMRITFG